ncbi:MAG: putative ABC transport system permease protein, partial [Paracoccaceae bacterium]
MTAPTADRENRGPGLWVALRIARRELRGGLKGFYVFLACLALGVAAIAAVGSVRMAISEGLSQEGRTILGGDAQISITYRFANDDERAWLADNAGKVSEMVDFRSMAVVTDPATGKTDRALTQVKGVDDAYPLYGALKLTDGMAKQDALAEVNGRWGVAMHPTLIARLGLEIGDTVRFGTADYDLRAAIVSEPDVAAGGFGFGPRTIMYSDALAASGLLGPGTIYDTRYRLTLPQAADLDAMKVSMTDAFPAAGMRWSDKRNAAPGIQTFVDRIGSFLVLVGLAALAMGGVGVAAAVRSYLEGKTATIATLKTLGAEGRVIFAVYLIQIAALAVLGVLIGLAIGAAIPAAAGPLLADKLPVPAMFTLYLAPLAEAALYGILTA